MSTSNDVTPGVHGLSTPQLNGGEITDASTNHHIEASEGDTIFDITLTVEAKLKDMLEKMEQNDAEVNKRISALSDKILQLESDIKRDL